MPKYISVQLLVVYSAKANLLPSVKFDDQDVVYRVKTTRTS